MNRTHCDQPDRDVPELVCGYSLPCPYHTVTLHADKEPPTVEIPATIPKAANPKVLNKLKEIVRTVREEQAP